MWTKFSYSWFVVVFFFWQEVLTLRNIAINVLFSDWIQHVQELSMGCLATHHGLISTITCTLFNTYLHLLYTFAIKNLFRQWGSLKPVTKLQRKSSNHKYNRNAFCPVKFTHYNNHLCISSFRNQPIYINCIETVILEIQRFLNQEDVMFSYIKFQFNCSIKCMHIRNICMTVYINCSITGIFLNFDEIFFL